MDKYTLTYMDETTQEDFCRMFCSEVEDETCDECMRQGACCLECKWRVTCKKICKSEKARQEMETWSGEKLTDALLLIGSEHVIYLVAADRIKKQERELAELNERIGGMCK